MEIEAFVLASFGDTNDRLVADRTPRWSIRNATLGGSSTQERLGTRVRDEPETHSTATTSSARSMSGGHWRGGTRAR
jgi:hypothetical protein